MSTITMIAPIFTVIGLGALVHERGFIPDSFLGPANKLVYYLAIPALVFHAISRSSISSQFNLSVILISIACVTVAFALALFCAYAVGIGRGRAGTFIQSSFHGNLGYMGLPILYYSLGDSGFGKGSIIAGLIMIIQNLLAVFALQISGDKNTPAEGTMQLFKGIVMNPVILSVLLGIGYGWWGVPMPLIFDRSLKVVGGMALPLALLLIGATLSVSLVKKQFNHALLSSVIKLIVMPATGVLVFFYFKLPSADYLPAVILLAAPTATVTYVYAKEMSGDTGLAVATISVSTILSGFTYTGWLHFLR